MLRLSAESSRHSGVAFLTLTYNDSHLPYISLDASNEDISALKDKISSIPYSQDLSRLRSSGTSKSDYIDPRRISLGIDVPTVDKQHVVKWLKLSRERYYRSLGSRLSLKYFVCSEYGPRTLRPHYHVLLFFDCNPMYIRQFFKDSWEELYGHCDFVIPKNSRGLNGDFSKLSRYLGKYCSKPSEFENPYVLYHVVQKCFRLMSLGLGSNLIYQIKSRLRNHPYKGREFGDFYGFNPDYLEYILISLKIKNGNNFYSTPRYIRDKSLYRWRPEYKLRWDSKTASYRNKVIYSPDKETRLSFALDNYILYKHDEIYNSKYQQIQSQYPSWTDAQIHRALAHQERTNNEERYKSLLSASHKFYLGNFLKNSL